MTRPLPQDRALLMKLLDDIEKTHGVLGLQTSAIRMALDQEDRMRPLDEIFFQKTGGTRLHHHGVTSPELFSAGLAGLQALCHPLPWECLGGDELAGLASGYQVFSTRVAEALADLRRHALDAQDAGDVAQAYASMLAARDAYAVSLRELAGQLSRTQAALRRLRERVLTALEAGTATQGPVPPDLRDVWHEFTDTERMVLEKIWQTRKPEGTPVADLFPQLCWEGKEKADKNLRVHLAHIKEKLGRRKLPVPWERKKGLIFWVSPGR